MPSNGLAEHLAQQVVACLPVDGDPLIDVELVALHLGVRAITRRRMVEDGRLDHGPSRIEITVKESTSATRQRFTIAHEIGHVLLTDPGQTTMAYRALAKVNDIERFCDDFAAALLMPQAWVADGYRNRLRNLSTLRHLSHRASTSLSAAVVRLNRVLNWNHALVIWAKRDGIWRYQYSAGLPTQIHRDLRTTATTRHRLDEIMARTSSDTNTQLTLAMNGTETYLTAQVSASRGTAVALMQLRET
jgi:Zn-dependent peptidase ImmA (M78 family)